MAEQKMAIVTGTSSGLGEAFAKFLLAEDFLVFGASRTEAKIRHPNFIDFELDVRSESSVKSFYAEIAKETEVIDLLVNNAGVCEMANLAQTSSRDFIDHFSTNVLGGFHLLKGFEPFIIEEESLIVNILSTASLGAYPGTSAYTCAEVGKKSLFEVIEKEWQHYHLRFSNLILGAVDTPLWSDYDDVNEQEMLSIAQVLEAFKFLVRSDSGSKISQLVLQPRKGFLE